MVEPRFVNTKDSEVNPKVTEAEVVFGVTVTPVE
jgi:hypothetical protein